MKKSLLLFLIAAALGMTAGCSSSRIVTSVGDTYHMAFPGAHWYAQFPSSDFKLIDAGDLAPKNSVVLRNTHRKMSLTFRFFPSNGHRTAAECRDEKLPKGSILVEPGSLHTYEQDTVAFAEWDVNRATGYHGHYVEATYLKNDVALSAMIYLSDFNQSLDKLVCDDVFSKVVFVDAGTSTK